MSPRNARTIPALTALAGMLLALTGCASEAGQEAEAAPAETTPVVAVAPEPELTADPNDQTCIRFAEDHNELASLLEDGKQDVSLGEWKRHQILQALLLAEHAEHAEGEISALMTEAAALIPEAPLDMVTPSGWRIGDAYNEAIADVYAACEADGIAYEMAEVTLPPEIFRE